jgi:hypothetical protein
MDDRSERGRERVVLLAAFFFFGTLDRDGLLIAPIERAGPGVTG